MKNWIWIWILAKSDFPFDLNPGIQYRLRLLLLFNNKRDMESFIWNHEQTIFTVWQKIAPWGWVWPDHSAPPPSDAASCLRPSAAPANSFLTGIHSSYLVGKSAQGNFLVSLVFWCHCYCHWQESQRLPCSGEVCPAPHLWDWLDDAPLHSQE